MDKVLEGYIEAALWSSCDEYEQPLDSVFTKDDIHPDTLAEMAMDCQLFLEQAETLLTDEEKSHPFNIGLNFWLNRNHHGAGFWDGNYLRGYALSDVAYTFGTVDLYVVDGVVHSN